MLVSCFFFSPEDGGACSSESWAFSYLHSGTSQKTTVFDVYIFFARVLMSVSSKGHASREKLVSLWQSALSSRMKLRSW